MLDKIQQEIVETPYDQVLVVAGSGSGKTRVITERINYLIKKGVDQNKIIAITFTNAAADEMRERLDERAKDVFIGTIHGYANRLLLMNGYDTSICISEENFNEFFSLIKNNMNCINEVDHLLIDEFQDIDDIQYEFLFNMVNSRNVFCVGDDWQAIYSFRGANLSHFLEMTYDPRVQVYKMGNNYRTAPNIVKFANGFLYKVKRKIEKSVECKNYKNGTLIEIRGVDYDAIAEEIGKNEQYSNWFILTRSNAQVTDTICELANRQIPAMQLRRTDFSNDDFKNVLKKDCVKVMTAHSAKGLENENVVVIGIMPFNDDERRLAYVAATRAKNKLIWCYKKRGQRAQQIGFKEW